MAFDALPSMIVAGLNVRGCGPENQPTICFLHGGGVSGWMWRPQIEALHKHYHCFVPDLSEHGLSAAIQPFTITDAAHRIATLTRERGHGGRAHVIGLSEGAQIGGTTPWECARSDRSCDYRQRVAPSASRYESAWFRCLEVDLPSVRSPFLHANWYVRLNMRYGNALPEHYFQDVHEDTRRMTDASFTHLLMENQRFRLPMRLDQVQMPALVVAGQHEFALVRQSSRELAVALPAGQGYLVALSRRGAKEHSWNLQRPEFFNAVVCAWLTDQPLPPALLPLG